jgi:transketolase
VLRAPAPSDVSDTRALAKKIRIHALHMTSRGGSSHIGAVLSMADIVAVLYSGVLTSTRTPA